LPTSALSHLRKSLGGTSFIEKGEGEALLLIHGVGLNAEAWGPQIEAFSATHRVIALDMFGHGAKPSAAAIRNARRLRGTGAAAAR
jgi:pimeloyl-ACP methyl ester carboxylesterase